MMAEKLNFMKNNKVFLLSNLYTDNTTELIADLTEFVDTLPRHNTDAAHNYKLVDPYNISGPKCPRVLDFTINSEGGHTTAYMALAHLISRAKSQGAIVRTTVAGNASSSASMLAIQGTPGFRVMYYSARHMIHWGSYPFTFHKASEVENMSKVIPDFKSAIHSIYLKCTDIPQAKLKKLMLDESSYISAPDCLKMNICDWIMMPDGTFIGHQNSR